MTVGAVRSDMLSEMNLPAAVDHDGAGEIAKYGVMTRRPR